MTQHMEEAAFLWTQWERGLCAPALNLADVETGDERRLLANLDALELGGRPVARQILLPALLGDDAEQVRVAAYALLCAEGADWREQILERLAGAEGDEATALLRAVELRGCERLGPALLELLPRLPPPEQARLLAALRFCQVEPHAVLAAVPSDEYDGVRAEKLRMAGLLPQPEARSLVLRGLTADSPLVREAALEVGLVLGLREAWANCTRWVAAREGGRVARLAVAVFGGPRELESLLSLLEEPKHRDEALWALGFSGRLPAAEAALRELMRDGAPLAAECFAAITGLPQGEPFWGEADTDDAWEDEDELLPVPDTLAPSELPGPLPQKRELRLDAVTRWWAGVRRRFEPNGRYLRGEPFTGASLATELEVGPMRRRPALVLEVAIRTRDSIRVEPRTWTSQQQQQAREVPRLRPEAFARKPDALFK